MHARLALALVVCLFLPGQAAHAEGTDQLGTSQALLAATELRVDILDADERIVWTGRGDVAARGPSGAQLGVFEPGFPIPAAEGPGAYALSLTEDQRSGERWNVAVTGGAGDAGRLWSTSWLFDGGGFGAANATSASFYVLVGEAATGTAVIELRFDGLAGFEYVLLANRRGVDGPLAGRPGLGRVRDRRQGQQRAAGHLHLAARHAERDDRRRGDRVRPGLRRRRRDRPR